MKFSQDQDPWAAPNSPYKSREKPLPISNLNNQLCFFWISNHLNCQSSIEISGCTSTKSVAISGHRSSTHLPKQSVLGGFDLIMHYLVYLSSMSASIDAFLCGGMVVCFMLSSMREGTLKGCAIAKCSMLSAQFCHGSVYSAGRGFFAWSAGKWIASSAG